MPSSESPLRIPLLVLRDGAAFRERLREYWVERLRSAPCGKWEIPDFGR